MVDDEDGLEMGMRWESGGGRDDVFSVAALAATVCMERENSKLDNEVACHRKSRKKRLQAILLCNLPCSTLTASSKASPSALSTSSLEPILFSPLPP